MIVGGHRFLHANPLQRNARCLFEPPPWKREMIKKSGKTLGHLEGAGMLQPDAPVDTTDVGTYFSRFYEPISQHRNITWTPEYASGIVRHTFDRSSPISQYASVPRAFVFIQRINLGLYALLGDLNATGNYRAIAEELWPFMQSPPRPLLSTMQPVWETPENGATPASVHAP